MLHQPQHTAQAGHAVCNGSADTGSIVDRLLAVAELPASHNEIDRAIAQHRQLTLARTIKDLIDGDDVVSQAA